MPKISYYTAARGDCPFQTFLDGSTQKVKAKFFKLMGILEEHGSALKRPYADFLRDGIWELRVGFGGDQYRALYFFWDSRDIIITHGIIKKSDRVPAAEIDRALRYKADFVARKGLGQLRD